jgi:HB1, ASXL, restriction endonuclease HTH domain
MAFWDGIRTVLDEAGEPLHVRVITKRILERGLWQSEGKTPEATVAARLYSDIKTKGATSQFVQAGKALTSTQTRHRAHRSPAMSLMNDSG